MLISEVTFRQHGLGRYQTEEDDRKKVNQVFRVDDASGNGIKVRGEAQVIEKPAQEARYIAGQYIENDMKEYPDEQGQ